MKGATGDTIVALSSGRLPAAIAVVRTSGPHALAAAASLCGAPPPPRRASLRTLRHPADARVIDRALVIFFPGPDSSTGEDIVEYQCHGSKAVVDVLIAALTMCEGVRFAEPGEFTRRALANGRIDLTQAEGLAELLEAESEAQRRSALLRAEGGLRRQIEQWRRAIVDLSAEAEVAIDYADEEDGGLAFDPAPRLYDLAEQIRAMLAAPRVERLRDGLRVVVAGPPNAGKSSLVNALAGEARAIVTPIPGTTRDLIEVPLAIDGIPLVLVDTAGLREAADEVERIGVGLAEREIERSDILLWLGAAADLPSHAVALAIAAKSDLGHDAVGVRVSSASGEGILYVKTWIAECGRQLVPGNEQPALNEREAILLVEALDALIRASALTDPLLVAEELRIARSALDRVSGLSGVEELLDALFGRFCLGK